MSDEMSNSSHNSELLEIAYENCERSVPTFLREVFTFLAKRTNFYDTTPNDGSNIPQVIINENVLLNIFKECSPHQTEDFDIRNFPRENTWYDYRNVFLPAAVAQEIEVTTSQEQDVECFSVNVVNPLIQNDDETVDRFCSFNEATTDNAIDSEISEKMQSHSISNETNEIADTEQFSLQSDQILNESLSPVIAMQADNAYSSDSYNGAVRDKYSWSQSIAEIDVTIKMPDCIKSCKELKINTTTENLSVDYLFGNGEWATLIKDKLSNKIRASESVWVINEGFIKIHLEKVLEKWWDSLLESESKIDTSVLNCTRPLHELSEDHIAKVREIQFNHFQKLAGKPTSDDIRNEEMLRRAWNAPGSPFADTPFDPTVLKK